ncbi:MAG: pilus assembly protein [Pseudomonadota bacterium]
MGFSIASWATGWLRRLSSDESATVMVLSAVVLPVSLFVIGAGVDYSNAIRAKATVANALDASVLAAARDLSIGDVDPGQVSDRVNSYFDANMEGTDQLNTTWNRVGTAVNEELGTLTGEVEVTVDTAFAGILQVSEISVRVNAEATYNILDLEISLVLDVTGSMRGRKLSDMKAASSDLIDILMSEDPEHGEEDKVRISVVPYSDLVNVGDFEERITGYDSGESCVYERPQPHAFTDNAPLGKLPGQSDDDNGTEDWSWGGCGNRYAKPISNDPQNYRGFRCNNPRLMPMSTQREQLKSHIEGFTAAGCTAGHIGIQWGWNTLSPNWDDVWPDGATPRDYGAKQNVKIMIVMTDGSLNTWFENGLGSSFDQGRSLCRNIKREGITIYTVAFRAPGNAEAFMRDCATSGEHYFNASSGTALRRSFEEIANRIRALRLSS